MGTTTFYSMPRDTEKFLEDTKDVAEKQHPMSRRYTGFTVRAVSCSCVCGGPLAWQLEFDDGTSTTMGCVCCNPTPDQVEVIKFLFENRHVCSHLTLGELAHACGLDSATAVFILKASFPTVQPKELK